MVGTTYSVWTGLFPNVMMILEVISEVMVDTLVGNNVVEHPSTCSSSLAGSVVACTVLVSLLVWVKIL